MIKDLIWDLDGTLFDTYPAVVRAFQSVFRAHHIDLPDEQVLSLTRVSYRNCANVVAGAHGLDAARIMEQFDQAYLQIPCETQPPFPGAPDVCRWTVACGGKNVLVTHRAELTSLRLLESFHLRGLFAGWVTGDMGFPRKPNPASFLAALQRFDLQPENALALGDRDLDLQAALAAGVRYTCAFGPDPFETPADFFVTDFRDLLPLLEQHQG